MLNFLFGGRKKAEVKIETQREAFDRLVTELNAAIDKLPDKPKVTLDPATGHILPEPPDQFPDEALALPGPAEASVSEKITEGDPAARVATEGGSKGAERATGDLSAGADR